MTGIKHHLNDALLMAYSAGTLPEAFSLVVATHISMCDDCRAALAAHDAVGGALLEDTAEVELAPEALDKCLAAIQALPPKGPIKLPKSMTNGAAPRSSVFPSPLAEYVQGDVEDVNWRSVGLGVRQAILPTSKEASVRLLYIPAGAEVPDHGHHGTELTLVLQGAFRDEFDRFGPGDIEVADPNVEHTPVAEAGEACICLAATDAPLKFRSILPKIAQPFLRI
ncbi:ChrR family anti-sigma-E factor [Dinoroseobacter sp. PD6]|uniref:ChrR family anti-sigma-E factor n=1 Tax=Dinoroseobacter sp. PD6 TaxID=3028384 RepID=UPI00237C2A72|nr:ChrR family anti-sigma-E factor [Dinoroseobacter sp. PD6]MDD9718908.1 ChrR family anti-sigma-E factor [Dinoroseobacter sp. PD6]